MSMPQWCRSRYAFLTVIGFWLVAILAVERLLPHQPVPRIGIEVLLAAALIVTMVWFDGWLKFLRETAPWFPIFYPTLLMADRVSRSSYNPLLSAFFDLLLVAAATLLYFLYIKLFDILYRRLIGAGDTVDRPSAPS